MMTSDFIHWASRSPPNSVSMMQVITLHRTQAGRLDPQVPHPPHDSIIICHEFVYLIMELIARILFGCYIVMKCYMRMSMSMSTMRVELKARVYE